MMHPANSSIGVSGDKTTAKFATKQRKPDGLARIHPGVAAERLSKELVTELSGISHGIGGFLNRYGVFTCGDMKNLLISILAKRFGLPARGTRDKDTILTFMQHMSERSVSACVVMIFSPVVFLC